MSKVRTSTYADFVNEITVNDPIGKEGEYPVEMSVFKHSSGGMFAIDNSYLEQCFDDDKDPVIQDPFNAKGKCTLLGC